MRRLHSHAELNAVVPREDSFVRWNVDPALPLSGAVDAEGAAVAWTVVREHYEHRPWLNAVGRPEAAAALVTTLLTTPGSLDVEPAGVSLPRGTIDLLPTTLRPTETGAWSWWWTARTPLPQTGERRVTLLDGTDPATQDELRTLLLAASPSASAEVGDPTVTTWMGLRHSGRLVACAADRPYVPGVPHLASVAVHPESRGHGFGLAVAAAITRRALVELDAPVVTLGMWTANVAGRHVYRRLGFDESHRFESGLLPTP